jgi:hypothetical protein
VWLDEAAELLREVATQMPSRPSEGSVPTATPVVSEDIYQSSNGDRWRLIRDTASSQAFVRHDPNPSSGGRPTLVEVHEFLGRDGPGPEFDALRRLLGQAEGAADFKTRGR